jgi:hypothetical protein
VSIALIAGGVSLIGTYIFGAVFDDRNFMNAIARNNDATPDNINTDIDPKEE